MNAADIWSIGLLLSGLATFAVGAALRGHAWKRFDGASVAAVDLLERSREVMIGGAVLIAAGIGAFGALELVR